MDPKQDFIDHVLKTIDSFINKYPSLEQCPVEYRETWEIFAEVCKSWKSCQ